MKTRNFVPIMLVVLLMVLATLACGDGGDIPAEYMWRVGVGGTMFTSQGPFYCKSYNIEGGVLTAIDCHPNDSTKIFSGPGWEVTSR